MDADANSAECILIDPCGDKDIRIIGVETFKFYTSSEMSASLVNFLAAIRALTPRSISLHLVTSPDKFYWWENLNGFLKKEVRKVDRVVFSGESSMLTNAMIVEAKEHAQHLNIDFNTPILNHNATRQLQKELIKDSFGVYSSAYYAAIYQHKLITPLLPSPSPPPPPPPSNGDDSKAVNDAPYEGKLELQQKLDPDRYFRLIYGGSLFFEK
jgi:hypothetical protein